jgi:hypothetical protein
MPPVVVEIGVMAVVDKRNRDWGRGGSPIDGFVAIILH